MITEFIHSNTGKQIARAEIENPRQLFKGYYDWVKLNGKLFVSDSVLTAVSDNEAIFQVFVVSEEEHKASMQKAAPFIAP